MACPYCGKDLAPNAKRCPHCGWERPEYDVSDLGLSERLVLMGLLLLSAVLVFGFGQLIIGLFLPSIIFILYMLTHFKKK